MQLLRDHPQSLALHNQVLTRMWLKNLMEAKRSILKVSKDMSLYFRCNLPIACRRRTNEQVNQERGTEDTSQDQELFQHILPGKSFEASM